MDYSIPNVRARSTEENSIKGSPAVYHVFHLWSLSLDWTAVHSEESRCPHIHWLSLAYTFLHEGLILGGFYGIPV